VVVERKGIPLASTTSAANVHDSRILEEVIDLIPPVGGRRGRPRFRPEKVHADKGYDYPRCREALAARGIAPRIARRGIDSKERLGRYRWVVERDFAWLHQMRRLRIRYERIAEHHQALLTIGCVLICWNFIENTF